MSTQLNSPPALKLEKVIGLTSLNNCTFCTSPNGDIFYAAGCFVVKYNPEDNKQKGFYKSSKAISSLAVSQDGRYLAIGERGQTPLITIWNIDKYEKLASLAYHKHGVGCLAFSPDGRYLVTVGFKLDRQLVLWEWRTNQKLSTQKLGNKVHSVSFHESGDFFVTAGDRHLKWWTITEVLEGEAVSLEGKAASILEDQRNSVFMDVICGSGSCDSSVFCTTSTGVLCLFNDSKMVEKWVQLESSSSFCLELFCADEAAGLLVVGCANGIVRCFDPETLQYISTLPLPAPLVGVMPKSHSLMTSHMGGTAPSSGSLYAACYGLRRIPGTRASPTPKLAAIYADRSLFVWDISDLYEIAMYRSFMFHRACVWDIQFIENNKSNDQASLPHGSFVTCSADNTVRFWNADPRMQRQSKFRTKYSREMLHSIDLLAGLNMEDTPDDEVNSSLNTSQGGLMNTSTLSATHYLAQQSGSVADLDVCAGIPDTELPDRPQSKYAPRALAVHPFAHEIACGDKMGTLKVFNINNMQEVSQTPAHAAEILTLSYSPSMVFSDTENAWILREAGSGTEQKEVVLLASAGRDRLVHVFNASDEYTPIQTLDHHSSSVTIAKFTSDGRRFLSCGGDRSMVFSSVDGPHIMHIKSVQTPHGTINGLAVEASNKFAVTSGQDKRLNIWNLHSGKHMRAYRNENVRAELYKSDIDPSGMYIATCAFDKTISIFDFFSGELVTQVSGHSELVTGVKFSPDGRFLVSIGGDGCILMWRVAEFLVKAMQDRLLELMTSAQRQNLKAAVAVRRSHSEGVPTASKAQLPPPPLPAPSFGLPVPPPSAAEVAPSVSESSSSVDTHGAPKKRWAVKEEYNIFEKKIDPFAKAPRLNQFTLELDGTTRAGIAAESERVAGFEGTARMAEMLEAGDDVMLSDEEDEGDGSHLFKPEAESSPQATGEEDYESDFEEVTGESAARKVGGALDEEDADSPAPEGKKNAKELENWLEDMIRSDGALDRGINSAATEVAAAKPSTSAEPVTGGAKIHQRRVINKSTGEVSVRPTVAASGPGSAAQPKEGETGGDPLDKSLSTAFFQNLRRGSDPNIAQRGDDLLPPPPGNPSATTEAFVDEATAELLAKERKKRDTAAAVAQMRERLRVMGILQKTQQRTPTAADAAELPSDALSEISPSSYGSGGFAPDSRSPAAKSTQAATPKSTAADTEDGYDTASTASEPEEVRASLPNLPKSAHVRQSSQDIASEIAHKSAKYRNILRDLELAKKKAAESYQELAGLRACLDESMRESVSFAPKARPSTASETDDSLNVSMAQVDQLLNQFQDSFTGFGATAGIEDSGHLGGTEATRKSAGGHSRSGTDLNFSRSSQSMEDSTAFDAFLERYSDKLVDLVGEKLIHKMNAKR